MDSFKYLLDLHLGKKEDIRRGKLVKMKVHKLSFQKLNKNKQILKMNKKNTNE